MFTMIFARNAFASLCWAVLTFGSLNVVLSKRLCGEELTKAFNGVCEEFPSYHDTKRSMEVPFEQMLIRLSKPNWYSPYLSEVADTESGTDVRRFGSSDATNAGLGGAQDRFRSVIGRSAMVRYRRAIEPWTHECCRRSCTVEELTSYCKVVAPGILESNTL
uniref:Insulin-like domain-containing protein n=1 Tax=Anopheles atroparvus TaxID=41427 RepID=A0A182J0I5_ANOAO